MIRKFAAAKATWLRVFAVVGGAIGCALLTFIGARLLWVEWTLYAVAFTAFIFLGGVRFWPWNWVRARPVGIGLMLGLIAAMVDFFSSQAP